MALLLSRQHTADKLNHVVNDPAVYPWVRGSFEGRLDMTPVVKDRRNICLMGEHGGVMFIHHQPGLYEAHTQVLPSGRGAWAAQAVKDAAHWMFAETEAVELITRVPRGNLGARAAVRLVHATQEFTVEKGWLYDGVVVSADIFALRIQDWMRTAPGLIDAGEKFETQLVGEYARHGAHRPMVRDETYLRYSGAMIEMIFAGQVHKGLVFFNRWASMVGHPQARILTEMPLVIELGKVLIAFRKDHFWIMSMGS